MKQNSLDHAPAQNITKPARRTIKVIHVPYCFYPDPVGGTEIYVASLARELESLGIENVIAAPAGAEGEGNYQFNGLRVRRYAGAARTTSMLNEVYGDGDPVAVSQFSRILEDERPDVVHMHALTRAVSPLIAREVKRRGLKLVFTYHTPTVSCTRGTLMRGGTDVCDGVLDRRICTRCTLQSRGVNGIGGRLLSAVPTFVGRTLGATRLEGKVATALRMSELIELRHKSFRALMSEADTVVALCQWTRELLILNGVSPAKISMSRHGLSDDSQFTGSRRTNRQGPLRMAFLGRFDPTKGADILINAIQLLPYLDVRLDLYGITQTASNDSYFRQLQTLAANDSRIAFCPTVPSTEVVSLLRDYDLLAVPSRWLETGPLVVLEAFAAGIPVIATNLGGTTELITSGRSGVLVEGDSPKTWAAEIEKLASDRDLLNALSDGVCKPRSMRDVAVEMLSIYESKQANPSPVRHSASYV